MIKVGPFGYCPDYSALTKPWDEMGKTGLCRIFVSSNRKTGLCSIQMAYMEGTQVVLSEKRGGNGSLFQSITLDYPSEYITSISGYYTSDRIKSITFDTNEGTYGPYGNEKISSTSTPYAINFGPGEFFGFHGYSNSSDLTAIGVYKDMIKVNAQGSCVSKFWDEQGKYFICRIFITSDNNGINSIQFGKSIIVLSNRFGGESYDNFFTVTLNYPVEYITIVQGTYAEMDGDNYYIVSSLTVSTNLRTYGPFGQIAGESFTIEMGADFFGFHGYRNRKYLRAIGVYIKPLVSVIDHAAPTTTTHDHLVQSAVKEE